MRFALAVLSVLGLLALVGCDNDDPRLLVFFGQAQGQGGAGGGDVSATTGSTSGPASSSVSSSAVSSSAATTGAGGSSSTSAGSGGGLLPPEVDVEPCALMVPQPLNLPAKVYAEHLFPGMTAADLAGVVAVGHVASNPFAGPRVDAPPGYDHASVTVFVTDGKVAARCSMTEGNGDQTMLFDAVQFVLPAR